MQGPQQDARRASAGADGPIGWVVGLWRYPVKSMGAESLDDVSVSWFGFAGDRRWAFIRETDVANGFPWLTIRDRPDMAQYRPRFVQPDRVETSPTMVRSPRGDEFDVVDPALAAELGDGVRLIRQSRGIFDTLPLSLITTQTIAAIGRVLGNELDRLRFRPNFVVEAAGRRAFPEDEWVGHIVRVGEMRMRVDARDRRCPVINVDPLTARRDPTVLRAVTRHRQACLGVYGSTVEPGQVAVGDPLHIERSLR